MPILVFLMGKLNINKSALKIWDGRKMKNQNTSVTKTDSSVSITEPSVVGNQLINEKCWVEFNSDKKEILGRDLIDRYNEPCFFNKTSRGIKKAWEVLSQRFTDETTLHDVITILRSQNIRCHYYCAVD